MVLDKAAVIAQLEARRTELKAKPEVSDEQAKAVQTIVDEYIVGTEKEIADAKDKLAKLKDAKKRVAKNVTMKDVQHFIGNYYGRRNRYYDLYNRYDTYNVQNELDKIERQLRTLALVSGDTLTIRPSKNNELSQILGL